MRKLWYYFPHSLLIPDLVTEFFTQTLNLLYRDTSLNIVGTGTEIEVILSQLSLVFTLGLEENSFVSFPTTATVFSSISISFF